MRKRWRALPPQLRSTSAPPRIGLKRPSIASIHFPLWGGCKHVILCVLLSLHRTWVCGKSIVLCWVGAPTFGQSDRYRFVYTDSVCRVPITSRSRSNEHRLSAEAAPVCARAIEHGFTLRESTLTNRPHARWWRKCGANGAEHRCALCFVALHSTRSAPA